MAADKDVHVDEGRNADWGYIIIIIIKTSQINVFHLLD